MVCLAYDCSGDDILVSLVTEKNSYEKIIKNANGTEQLMVAINAVMAERGMKINDVDVLAVGVGPGSWTGSRVAVVSTFGLVCGMAKKPKIIKFDSFDIALHNETSGAMVIKGFGNFVYVKEVGGVPEIIEKNELLNRHYTKLFSIQKMSFETIVIPQDLTGLVKKLLVKPSYIEEKDLEPLYLRKSQAELERERKLLNGNKN